MSVLRNSHTLKAFKHKNWVVSSIREALDDDDMDTVVAAIEQGEPIIDKETLAQRLLYRTEP